MKLKGDMRKNEAIMAPDLSDSSNSRIVEFSNPRILESTNRRIDESMNRLIDHTFLKAAGEKDAVEKLCREAKEYGFKSVCVNPCEVGYAAKALAGTETGVCTVIGFPLGQNTTAVKEFEARDAVENGARELDFVINVRLLKYDPAACETELVRLVRASREAGEKAGAKLVLKLIIECCCLEREEKILACRLAEKAGFDFVKTSTGFGTGGATVEDVKLMRETVGDRLGVKAAGGIRSREDALAMIEAGANRLGCSAGMKIVNG